MNKIKNILTLIAVYAALFPACSDKETLNALDQLCVETGGKFQNNRCVCSGETCDPNMVCTEEGVCPVNLSALCEHKEKKCTSSAKYECVKNLGWQQVEKCDKGCAEDGKQCAQCFDTSCKDDVLTLCSDNIATTITCKYGCNDAGNDCKPECEAGQVMCGDKVRLECNPETLTWHPVEQCDFACDLDKTGKTRCIDDCEHGATRCDDGKISTCINKKWSEPVDCAFDGACFNAEKCVECTVEDPKNPPKRCFNDVDGVAHIQVCNGKTYDDELVSPEGYSCKQNEVAFGNCNILAETFCDNAINADGQGHDLGIMYSCEDGQRPKKFAKTRNPDLTNTIRDLWVENMH